MTHVRKYSDRELYRRILRQARPCWFHIIASFFLSLLATPIALLTPVPLKMAIDNVIGSKPLPGFLDAVLPSSVTYSENALLASVAVLYVLIALLGQLQRQSTTLLATYIGEKLTFGLRQLLFRHVQRLSLSFHDMRGTADSVYRIQYDAASIQGVTIYGITPFVTAGFTMAGMVYVTGRIDWILAIVALVVAPVVALMTWRAGHRLRGGWRQIKRQESVALSVVQEVLTGLRVVKAFAQEEREQNRYLTQAGEGMRRRIRVAVIDGLYALTIGLMTAVGTALALYIGVSHVLHGTITLGDLVLVMGYLAQLYVPVQQIGTSITGLQSALTSAERAFSVLEEMEEVAERPHATPLGRAKGAVEFRQVGFAYDGCEPMLQDVSFTLPLGTRLGIVGATGAGKTTLVNLLMRFYDPTHGSILLDGVDLREYKLADLRNQFGIVLQEPVLFSRSIAENIAYGRPGAPFPDIAAAADAAGAHDFIRRLPDEYDTLVGERGMRLSGGERQRVSIARAFLRDAPILILDEPTSSVDVGTEAAIMEAMYRLMEGRTTFMIAHRLSTLDGCDERIEVGAGRIAHMTAGLRSGGERT